MIENAKIGFRPGFFSAVKSCGPKKTLLSKLRYKGEAQSLGIACAFG